MRAIAAPFFEQSPFLLGPLLTLVLFFVVFLGVLLYLARIKPRRFESLSSLPLADDGGSERLSGSTGATRSMREP